MPRDKRLTTHKLDRAAGALRDLLDCDDLEYREHIERASRAIDANARWHGEELAARFADGGEPEEEPPPAQAALPPGAPAETVARDA